MTHIGSDYLCPSQCRDLDDCEFAPSFVSQAKKCKNFFLPEMSIRGSR
jgi:hypothetical protein